MSPFDETKRFLPGLCVLFSRDSRFGLYLHLYYCCSSGMTMSINNNSLTNNNNTTSINNNNNDEKEMPDPDYIKVCTCKDNKFGFEH